jgi:hypothetical protein
MHERLRERVPLRVASEKVFGLELSPSTDESDLLLTMEDRRRAVASRDALKAAWINGSAASFRSETACPPSRGFRPMDARWTQTRRGGAEERTPILG